MQLLNALPWFDKRYQDDDGDDQGCGAQSGQPDEGPLAARLPASPSDEGAEDSREDLNGIHDR